MNGLGDEFIDLVSAKECNQVVLGLWEPFWVILNGLNQVFTSLKRMWELGADELIRITNATEKFPIEQIGLQFATLVVMSG